MIVKDGFNTYLKKAKITNEGYGAFGSDEGSVDVKYLIEQFLSRLERQDNVLAELKMLKENTGGLERELYKTLLEITGNKIGWDDGTDWGK